MIYHFNVRNEFNRIKDFYLTADTLSQLYRRILSTYGITKDRVSILEEYEEKGDSYKLKVSHVGKLSDKEKELMRKAKEIFSDQSRKCDPYKTDYMTKHKYTDEVTVESEIDVYNLLKKFKQIKVYWELTEVRGVRRIYALCKN